MKKDIVIFGAGGFGREVLWLLEEINAKEETWNILGFVADPEEAEGQVIKGYPVLGKSDWIINYPKALSVVCAVGSSQGRKQVADRISVNKNLEFPTIIAPGVQYSDTVTFGKGCIICALSVLTVNVELKDFVLVNLDCTIGHDAVLDDFVTLYPSVNISGFDKIGTCTEIGVGSNIIQRLTIGSHTIAGAGSVVIRDIPDGCTAVGSPAKPIKFLSQA